MTILDYFSLALELPNIPEGPGVCVIEDAQGHALQVTVSGNIRRRIGQLLDSEGKTCVHGPKIYTAQKEGNRIFIRWKLTSDYEVEKQRLMEELRPLWAP
jgi:hypothetical protein